MGMKLLKWEILNALLCFGLSYIFPNEFGFLNIFAWASVVVFVIHLVIVIYYLLGIAEILSQGE